MIYNVVSSVLKTKIYFISTWFYVYVVRKGRYGGAQCKKVGRMQKTKSGLENFIDEKGYGPWFNQLFAYVSSRDSCQPEQAIEPSASSLENENANRLL